MVTPCVIPVRPGTVVAMFDTAAFKFGVTAVPPSRVLERPVVFGKGTVIGLLSALTEGMVVNNPLAVVVKAPVTGVRPSTPVWASPAPLGIQSNPVIVIRITFLDMAFPLHWFGT